LGNGEKILVAGAGPAGLLTSLYIDNHDVVLVEEHSEVGKPKHCAGFIGELTVKRYASLLGWSVIDHKYNVVVFHTPRGAYTLYFHKPLIYHINRPLLEEKLLDKVLSKGHEIIFNTRVKPGDKPGKVFLGDKELVVDKIIAADGPHSVFRKKYFGKHKEWLRGVQYIYRASNLDSSTVHTLFNEYTPDFFQWLAPLDHDTVLIGFASKEYRVHPDKIVNYISRKTGVKLGSKLEVFGGVIPYDKPLEDPIIDDKIYFIGDSVPLIKPYTGGGLVAISLAGPALGLSIKYGDPSLYRRIYRLIGSRIIYEYFATNLARRFGYWIPPYIVYHLYRLGILTPTDYDNHYRLLFKSLPLSLYLIYKLVRP